MPPLENPFPNIVEAAEAATRILSIHADMFLVKQELRAVRQIKRVIWITVGLLLFNLLLTLTFFWLETGLHERGWSAFSLAALTLVVFGILTLLTGWVALRVGKEPNQK